MIWLQLARRQGKLRAAIVHFAQRNTFPEGITVAQDCDTGIQGIGEIP